MRFIEYIRDLGLIEGLKSYAIDTYNVVHERVSRTYAYAKFGYSNADFDHAYLWDLVEFKLKRIHRCFKESAVRKHPRSYMAPLEQAIKLAKRFSEKDYSDPYFNKLQKKWGKGRFVKTAKSESEKYTTYRTIRVKVKTPEDKKQYLKEMRECWKAGERDRKKDIQKFAKIIEKHSQSWWD